MNLDDSYVPKQVAALFANRIPLPIVNLFAAADAGAPQRRMVAIADVDEALQGLDIEKRLFIKCELRTRGLIA